MMSFSKKSLAVTLLLSSVIYVIIVKEVAANIFIKTGIALLIAGAIACSLPLFHTRKYGKLERYNATVLIHRKRIIYPIFSITLVIMSTTAVGIVKSFSPIVIFVSDIIQLLGLLYYCALCILLFMALNVNVTIHDVFYASTIAYGIYALTPLMALANFPIELVKFVDVMFVFLQVVLYNMLLKLSDYRIYLVTYTTEALANLVVGLVVPMH